MNEVTIDHKNIRAELIARRDELRARLDELNRPDRIDEAVNPDRADLAQNYVRKGVQAAIDERLEESLDQVEKTLARFEAGKYGLCEECGEPIGSARLEAMPYVDLCIDCQRKEERLRLVR